jgi:hypothetical protein
MGLSAVMAVNPAPAVQARASLLPPPPPLRTNRITAENALPGTDAWGVIGNYNINRLAAFVGNISINAGESVNIHVKSTAAGATSLQSRLYRLGYYQDHGARLYTTTVGIPITVAANQPNCTRQSSTGLVSCAGWAPVYTIPTDPNWISGIYLVQIDAVNGSGTSLYRFFVYFVLRNDGYQAPILFSEDTKTNQAYNDYGGESLYVSRNNEGRQRAYKVSFDRPYNSSAGTGTLSTHDLEAVRWIEASGYDVNYISDIDRVRNPSILQSSPVYFDQGHDEYWTWDERTAVENAVAAGVQVVFATANESYWHIRLEDSPIGPDRIIVCYKDTQLDPAPAPTPKTVTFRDLNRPENSLIGTGYQGYSEDATYNNPWVLNAPPDRWYFDCTGFQAGDRVNNIVGEEWDARLANGQEPPGLDVLSHGTIIDQQGHAQIQ